MELYRVYLHRSKEPVPVYARTLQSQESGELVAGEMIARARAAKALGELGDKYMADVHKVTVRNAEGTIVYEVSRDEETNEG